MQIDKNILSYLGNRLKQYRKLSGMTLEELAAKVYKSKSTICKYEAGHIPMDVTTLYDIARVLNVTPGQLLYYTPPSKAEQRENPFFWQSDKLFLYHMRGQNIHTSILTFDNFTNQNRDVTLFYKVASPRELDQCDCIYHGHMHYRETALTFILHNYNNTAEWVLINFLVPVRKNSVLIGMISGLGVNTMLPTSYKVLLSLHAQPQDDQLRKMLTIDLESIKEMKRKNTVYIPLTEV